MDDARTSKRTFLAQPSGKRPLRPEGSADPDQARAVGRHAPPANRTEPTRKLRRFSPNVSGLTRSLLGRSRRRKDSGWRRRPRRAPTLPAGGGGRTDLGILARTDEIWASDNTDATGRITIQHGYGQLYPAGTMSAWVTDSPNPTTGQEAPLSFRCHVAMAGVLGLGGNLPRWSAAELEEAAALVALYKEIRPVVQHGELYRLADPARSAWTAVQYVLGDSVVVFFWRRPAEFARLFTPPRLAGLNPAARYRDQDGGLHHGAVLLSHGIDVDLPGSGYASVVVRLTRGLNAHAVRRPQDG
ncbi:alpha-galactosidase [Amycolatopsis sp. NPDC049252]|uniref:alpha-galactosidase n=1 Tax=Amycolatopsis sp. NPDC049252 TaxID=3363933 RepID=UPI00371E16F3